ncbi:MAG: iron ABC transporter permease [Lachnospiraceae bacterium]|nr:iron ABC transporter permease [Lachnospiraceae bacterium]
MKEKKHLSSNIILIVLPIITALASLMLGRIFIAPSDVFSALFKGPDIKPLILMTVTQIRLPRILLALLAGAGLSVAGCVFQSLFDNPLATPDTLGVASGASFGAALALLLHLGMVGVQLTSFTFGLVAVVLTFLAGSGKSKGMSAIVLSGIMIGSLFSSLVSLIKFVADEESELPAITYWLMGSLSGAGYKNLIFGAPAILFGLIVIYLIRWKLNLLPLREEEAVSTGVNIKALRVVTMLCATLMTASVISMCGQVGWVGLLIPHMCRMMVGSNHKRLIPFSISIGAAFMVAVDTVARSATASEIPISILTAIIGAPFFIYLMRRTRLL